ncbi:hypothetical protein [Streptomyces sp. NPDC059076]|uniref:hypothetical protein n=1 Tax=unclassified Streptomyces TaxID=2593676 RepID=UPI0036A86A70
MTTVYSPKVTRALANIEGAKAGDGSPSDLFLDYVATLITRSGDPDGVFDQVLRILAQAQLDDLLDQNGLRLVVASGEGEHLTTCALVVGDALLMPSGLDAGAQLDHARAAVEAMKAARR